MTIKVDRSGFGDLASLRRARATESAIEEFMAVFFSEHVRSDGPGEVFSHLTEAELSHTKASQEAFLRQLLDPELPSEELDEIAQRIGYVHSMVGVRPSWLLEVIPLFGEMFHKSALACQVSPKETELIVGSLSRRLGAAMRSMVAEDERIDELVSVGLEEVNRAVANASTGADLIRGVLSAIYSIEGVASVSYGRPDVRGHLLYEHFEGTEFARYLELLAIGDARPIIAHADAKEGAGPSGRAWRSGEIQHSVSFAKDPTMEPWREMAAALGLRSVMVLPIVKSDGESVGVVNIYSKWPGYFAVQKRARAFAYVQQVISSALIALDSRNVVPYEKRNQYREMLRSDSLEMHFQPIVDLRTGHVVKLEALARLRDSDGSLLSPAEFMGAFGSEDLYLLFYSGLAQSLGALVRLEAQGVVTGMSLNLPSQGVKDRRYLEAVVELLGKYQVRAERLTLELTEEEQLNQATFDEASLLWRLRGLGVLLAQDDLGAGYSSLLRLERFGFHDVKIDQELVRGAADPRNALDLIQHLTRLAHDLGIEVVVEGLESAALIEAAAIMGADYGQGYGIARPLPEDEVAAFFANFRWHVNIAAPSTALGALAALRRWSRQLVALGSYSGLIESSLPIDELKGYLKRFPALDLDTHFAKHSHRSAEEFAVSLLALETEISSLLESELPFLESAATPTQLRRRQGAAPSVFSIDQARVAEVPFTGTQLTEILSLQNVVLHAMARGASSAELLEAVCLGAEAMFSNSVATVMRLGEDGRLHLAAGPSLSASAAESFRDIEVGEGSGSCANAVLSNTPTFVANTQLDPRWRDIADLANTYDLRACWSMPVRDGADKVLGTFAISSFENGLPNTFHRTLLDTCANLVAVILERQSLGEEVEAGKVRLWHMFDGNQAVKFVFDADSGEIMEVNSAGAEFYGYRAEEFRALTIFDINVEITPSELSSIATQALDKGSFHGRARHRIASGELRNVEFFTHVYLEGTRRIFVSIIQDVSERFAAEAKLSQERHLTEGVLDALSGMVVVLDAQGSIVRFNREAEEITGYSFAEVKGNPHIWRNWIDSGDAAMVAASFREIISGGSMGRREVWHTSRSGIRRLIAMRDAKVLDGSGNVEATVLLGTDITRKHHIDEEIRLERDFSASVMDAIGDVIIVMDRYSNIIKCNRALEELLGIPCAELIGKPSRVAEYFVEEGRAGAYKWFAQARSGDVGRVSVVAMRDSGGRRRIFEWKAVPLYGFDAATAEYFVITGSDITAKRNEARQLKRAAVVFENSAQAILITNGEGEVLDANPAFCSAMGYSREEVFAMDTREVAALTNSGEVLAEIDEGLGENGTWSGTLWLKRKNGEVFPAFSHVSALLIQDQEEANILTMFSDISDMIRHQEELADLAYHDALTSLPNRSLLAEKISDAMAGVRRRGGMLGLAYLDLDNFKPINDTYGHSYGDHFLVELSQRISAALREVDTVARIGGDEFVCLLADLDSTGDSEMILARLIEAIGAPVELGEDHHPVSVSASIGVVYYSGGDADPDAMLRRADQLMYEAKRAGGNRCVAEEM